VFNMFLVIILVNFAVTAVEGPMEALTFLDMVYVYGL